MAGGGDSVAGVILLPFPQTGAGCRFKALVPMFQQAEEQTQTSSRTKQFSVYWKTRSLLATHKGFQPLSLIRSSANRRAIKLPAA